MREPSDRLLRNAFMSQYAYRGIAENGAEIRVALAASDPQAVIEHARAEKHHVVMMYLLTEGGQPHFRQLFRHPNRPLPGVLNDETALRCGLSVRKKLMDWVWSTPKYETAPLLQKLLSDSRAMLFKSIGVKRTSYFWPIVKKEWKKEPISPPKYEQVRRVDISDDYEPPEEARRRISRVCARYYQIVPLAYEDGGLVCVAADPTDTDDPRDMLSEKPTIRLRCSDDPKENAGRVRKLIERIYARRPENDLWQPRNVADWRHEPWTGACSSLTPLPELNAEETSRWEEFINFTADLTRTDGMLTNNGVRRFASMIMMTAVRDSDGISIGPDEMVTFHGAEREAGLELLEFLCDPVVTVLAGIVGIDLGKLGSARAQIELSLPTGRYIITSEKQLTDLGERLEMRWWRE